MIPNSFSHRFLLLSTLILTLASTYGLAVVNPAPPNIPQNGSCSTLLAQKCVGNDFAVCAGFRWIKSACNLGEVCKTVSNQKASCSMKPTSKIRTVASISSRSYSSRSPLPSPTHAKVPTPAPDSQLGRPPAGSVPVQLKRLESGDDLLTRPSTAVNPNLRGDNFKSKPPAKSSIVPLTSTPEVSTSKPGLVSTPDVVSVPVVPRPAPNVFIPASNVLMSTLPAVQRKPLLGVLAPALLQAPEEATMSIPHPVYRPDSNFVEDLAPSVVDSSGQDKAEAPILDDTTSTAKLAIMDFASKVTSESPIKPLGSAPRPTGTIVGITCAVLGGIMLIAGVSFAIVKRGTIKTRILSTYFPLNLIEKFKLGLKKSDKIAATTESQFPMSERSEMSTNRVTYFKPPPPPPETHHMHSIRTDSIFSESSDSLAAVMPVPLFSADNRDAVQNSA